jgi:hypothetical protein
MIQCCLWQIFTQKEIVHKGCVQDNSCEYPCFMMVDYGYSEPIQITTKTNNL